MSSSKWLCASRIVAEAGPLTWRFTVNLRPVNLFTISYQFPIPLVKIELTKTAWSRIYANLDFPQRHWQVPLHPVFYECQSFGNLDNVYTPMRVLHSTFNVVLHLQLFLEMNLPNVLRPRALLVVYHSLFYEPITEALLDDKSEFL